MPIILLKLCNFILFETFLIYFYLLYFPKITQDPLVEVVVMIKGEDFIGVTVIFYCHDGRGRFLWRKRSENCQDEIGRWVCGGGSLDFGESFEDVVRREVKKEYCCGILNLRYLGTNNLLGQNNGRPTRWVAILFAVQVIPEEVRIGEPEKVDDIGWFYPEDFPTPCTRCF